MHINMEVFPAMAANKRQVTLGLQVGKKCVLAAPDWPG